MGRHLWLVCSFVPCVAVTSTPARADAPVAGDWSGLLGPVIAAFVVANAVPDYSMVKLEERHSGAQWDLPFEFKLGLTHTLAPSLTWYPGADDVVYRGTWRIQIPFSDEAEGAFGFSPGFGFFTSRDHGRGLRYELRLWAAIAQPDGWLVRRYPGLFVGGALEQNHTYEERGWEAVAGFEFPIPIDMVFGAEE